MNTMSKFQIVFIGILVVAIVGAVLIFASYKGSTTNTAQITIWGTISSDTFSTFQSKLSSENKINLNLSYIQKNPATFDTEFIEALAIGRAPDAILLPQDLILRHQDKLIAIPFTSFSERDFKDTYIQNAEIYLSKQGVIAMPFSVDPLVMYWNRDIFSNSSISQPPTYWDEFYALADILTIKDTSLNILKATVSLGEYSNVDNAKAIISSLLMQAGTPIVQRDETTGDPRVVLKEVFNFSAPPAQSAVTFYTQFANPVKSFYSWNRSLPSSREMFLAGDLATYFGFASEYSLFQKRNPNLNFDVARFPQSRNSNTKITFGNINGFAVVRQSTNTTDAFNVVITLTSKPAITAWNSLSGLPPVRRDLLSVRPSDIVGPLFYDSALWSRSWLDPNPEQTNQIFKEMIENTTTGKTRVDESVSRANSEIDSYLK